MGARRRARRAASSGAGRTTACRSRTKTCGTRAAATCGGLTSHSGTGSDVPTPDREPGVDDVNIIWEGPRTRGVLAFKRRPVFSGLGQSWLRLSRSRARTARKAAVRSLGPSRPNPRSRRARPKVSNDTKVLAGGQQAAWEKAATHPPQRKTPTVGDVFARQVSRRNASRPDAGPAADAWIQVGTDINVWYYEQRVAEQRRQRILRVGRRGAAATRPLSTVGVGGASTNRTGAGAAPVAIPVPRPSTAPVPGQSRVELPSGSPAVNPAPVPGALPGIIPQPAPASIPAPSPGARPASVPASSPLPFQVRIANLGEQLLSALTGPRPATIVRPLPTTLTSYGPGASPSLAAQPGLTPSNSPLLGFSQQTLYEPTPQEDLDKCKCPKKRKRSDKKRCTNPVISRTRAGDILTTKVRLVCPSSRTNKRSRRTLPFPTL